MAAYPQRADDVAAGIRLTSQLATATSVPSQRLNLSEHVNSPGFGGFYQGRTASFGVSYDMPAIFGHQSESPSSEGAWRYQPVPDVSNDSQTPGQNLSTPSTGGMSGYRASNPRSMHREEDGGTTGLTPSHSITVPSPTAGMLPITWPDTNSGPPPATPFVPGDWGESKAPSIS